MKKIFYWSPHINPQVATCKAVLNSAYSLQRYSKNFEPVIVNCFGEWDYFKEELKSKNIKLINLFNIKVKLPIDGFIKSRLFYITFSLLAIFPLYRLIKQNKPDYFILHLIVIPVLILSKFSKHSTKFILRISGFPKLNLFRKFFWNLFSKKISTVFSPTKNTIKLLQNEKIFDGKNIRLLEDPIIEINKINKLKRANLSKISKKTYLLSAGRLTHQKNFSFLINSFNSISKNEDLKLLIIGTGEQKKNLLNKIKKLNLEDRVILGGYKKNIFKYINNSKLFILASEWEDPGFVIVEAAVCGKLLICSKVPSGPIEFIGEDESCGFLFEKNSPEDFSKKINYALQNLDSHEIKLRILNAKKKTINYTLFRHAKKLSNFLDNLH